MTPQTFARSAVVEQSLTWRNTPFEYGQCVKGDRGGVDCGRFIASCLNDAGVRKIDIAALPKLSPQWFLHRSDESFIKLVRQFATEYRFAAPCMGPLWFGPTKPRPEPGDIVVAKCGRDWAHSALVIEWPRVIGAACEHVVTVWENIHRSPQLGGRDLRFFDPFIPAAPCCAAMPVILNPEARPTCAPSAGRVQLRASVSNINEPERLASGASKENV